MNAPIEMSNLWDDDAHESSLAPKASYSGVDLSDSVLIHPEVTIAPTAQVEPGARIHTYAKVLDVGCLAPHESLTPQRSMVVSRVRL